MNTANTRRFVPVLGLSLALAWSSTAVAVVRFVDDSSPPGGTGLSWLSPYNTLQAALAVAGSGDEIRVGQGTYKPAGPGGSRLATFTIPSGVIVRGGYQGFGSATPDSNSVDVNLTILSGDLNGNDGAPGTFTNYGDNSHHVITLNAVAAGTAIERLYIRSGSADVSALNDLNGRGGGITSIGACTVTLSLCRLQYNHAFQNGGAAFFSGGIQVHSGVRYEENRVLATIGTGASVSCANATASFLTCQFQAPLTTLVSPSGSVVSGGTLTVTGCDFRDYRYTGINPGNNSLISNCTFHNCNAEDGGGIYTASTNVRVRNCRFVDCQSASFGGAIAAWNGSNVTAVNCRFHDCRSTGGPAVSVRGTFTGVNCLFSGNSPGVFSGNGSAVFNQGTLTLINCTLANNNNPGGGPSAAVHQSGAGTTTTLRNCVLWGNTTGGVPNEAAQIFNLGGTFTIANCSVQDWTGALGGVNNNNFNPNFMDLNGPDNIIGTLDDNGQTFVNAGTINGGDNLLVPADIADLDGDGNTTERVPLDLNGLGRFAGGTVDRGAFELRYNCVADIAPSGSTDSTVNVQDLLAVIGGWGVCGSACPGDVAPAHVGNGLVNVEDLLAVIGAWGACPSACSSAIDSAYIAHGPRGAAQDSCCATVCAIDPYCCEVAWDGDCVTAAFNLCSDCGDAGTLSCSVAQPGNGCSDGTCCHTVCTIDPYCCDTVWDNICAREAAALCP